jgi:hypothetical protein
LAAASVARSSGSRLICRTFCCGLETYYITFFAIFGSGLGYVVGVFLPLFVGAGTGTPVWVVHETDGGKKAMIGYRHPKSSPDESI